MNHMHIDHISDARHNGGRIDWDQVTIDNFDFDGSTGSLDLFFPHEDAYETLSFLADSEDDVKTWVQQAMSRGAIEGPDLADIREY